MWSAALAVLLTLLRLVDLFSLTNHLPGCCWLVGLHCVNGAPHMAAASFRANLLNLMDSEKAFGLHVLALPIPCFLSFFLCFFLSNVLSVPIDYKNFLSTLGYILPPLLSVSSLLRLLEVLQQLSKQVWSLTKVRDWSSLCSSTIEVNGARSVFLAHDSFSVLSRLFNSPPFWCYLTGEGV